MDTMKTYIITKQIQAPDMATAIRKEAGANILAITEEQTEDPQTFGYRTK